MEEFNASDFKILIVDDITKNIQVIGNILREEGYKFEFATNGKKALNWTAKENFDLILLDIMMPEMNGFETCEELKKDPKTKEIPIIFLTAKTETENVTKSFEIGAVDYITKPFIRAELVARIKTHLIQELSKKQLIQLLATKNKFFSIIAHDLKNPFSSLIGFSQFILDNYKKLDEVRMLKNLQFINTSANQGYKLLENLLDWSRSQTGHINYKPENINLSVLVEESIKLYEESTLKKEIKLESEIEENTIVFADYNMISTICRNLISNAIKFTPRKGSITISSHKDTNFVVVKVADSGVGISQANIDRLFKIEEKCTTKGTEDEKGTGLGLLLCKEFIEYHGGKIWIESEEGKGSSFLFTLSTKK